MSTPGNPHGLTLDELLGNDISGPNNSENSPQLVRNNNNNNLPNNRSSSNNSGSGTFQQQPKSLITTNDNNNLNKDTNSNHSGTGGSIQNNINKNNNNDASGLFVENSYGHPPKNNNAGLVTSPPQSNPLNSEDPGRPKNNNNSYNNFDASDDRNSPSSAWMNASGVQPSPKKISNNSGSFNSENNNNNASSQNNQANESVSSIKALPTDAELDGCLSELVTYQRHPAIFFCFVSIMGFAFSIASTATTAYSYDRGTTTTTQNRGVFDLTLWTANWCIYSWSSSTCANARAPFSEKWCTALSDRWRAMQAFSIIVILYSAVILVFGIAAAFPKQETVKNYIWGVLLGNRIQSPAKFILVISSGFWLVILVLWALIAGSYHVTPCDATVATGQRNRLLGVRTLMDSGFKLSSSFALTLVLWFYLSGSLLWILVKHMGNENSSQSRINNSLNETRQTEMRSQLSQSQQQQQPRSASRNSQNQNSYRKQDPFVPEL